MNVTDKSKKYSRSSMLHYIKSVVGSPTPAALNQLAIFTVTVEKKEPELPKESKKSKRARTSITSAGGTEMKSILSIDALTPQYIKPPPGVLPTLSEIWQDFFWYENWGLPITTVELRNLAFQYKPVEVAENIMADKDFGGSLNFVYLPPDPMMIDMVGENGDENGVTNMGVCILNFATEEKAQLFYDAYNDRKSKTLMPKYPSARTLSVLPARAQGLEWNLEELRRDQILERLGPESEWRPLLFNDGKPTPFTVSIRNKRGGLDSPGGRLKPGHQSQPVNPEIHSTIMFRNIPNKYTRSMLHGRLNETFGKLDYDFIYMPIDFNNKCNVGYAFVNFRNKEAIEKVVKEFHNKECQVALPGFNSSKVVEITPARVQGLENNIEHLQNSTVIDQLRENGNWTPLLFDSEGNEKPFPCGEKKDPKKRDSKASAGRSSRGGTRKRLIEGRSFTQEYYGCSTISFENIPQSITPDDILKLLEDSDFKGEVDFLYLPAKEGRKKEHQGIAIINFRRGKGVSRIIQKFNDRRLKEIWPEFHGDDEAKAVVVPAKLQGLHNNIEQLRNAGILDDAFGDFFPLVFDANGDRLDVSLNISSPMRGDAPAFSPKSFNIEAQTGDEIIQEQMEYYFSEKNLVKDAYLKNQMDNEGWITYELLKSFPKLKLNSEATLENIKKLAECSPIFETNDYKLRLAHAETRKKYLKSENAKK